MRRRVPIASLSVGRCFALEPPSEGLEEDTKARRFQLGAPILKPELVWKFVATDSDGQVVADNALGERKRFDGKVMGLEVPRQGYELLASRARES